MFGAAQGAYADRVAADWKSLQPLPQNMSFDQGAGETDVSGYCHYWRGLTQWMIAGLQVTWPTSYEALVGRAELKPGDSTSLRLLNFVSALY